MPRVHLLTGGVSPLRRLLASTLSSLASRGYDDVRRQEAGEWAALLSENRGKGLFGDKSVVVVEEAERLGPMPPRLAPMLDGPESDVHIVLVCKGDAPSIIPKELSSRCDVARAADPSPWSKERDETVRAAARRYGAKIRGDAVSLLKELFEDLSELESEAAKLAEMFAPDRREISASDVEALCMSDGSRSLLKLLDGICSGRVASSLSALEETSSRGELIPLVSALHNRMRAAFYFARHPEERSDFERALGMKEYASRQAANAARLYGCGKLLGFVTGLIRINSNEKSGAGASWRDLTLLVMELMSETSA
jgi:DNA polymerase-3 subunit delta